MKKGMMVVTIVAALSFLFSMIAVSSCMAVKATKTGPAPKQVPTQKTPPTSPKEKVPVKVPVQGAKAQFWDLAVDHCVISGQLLQCNPCQGKPTVKVGQPATITCYYTMKAIQISDITDADAKFWGSGNLKYYVGIVVYGDGMAKTYKKEELRSLPKFTWENVQVWKKNFIGTYRKTWTEHIAMTWTPQWADLGDEPAGFSLGPNYGGASNFKENEAEGSAAHNNVCGCTVIVSH
jgi:hypothetical protein